MSYDLESLLSPTLAAALLTMIGFHWLFGGTVIGFLASAALVLSVRLPQPTPAVHTGGIYEKTTRGSRIYLATPRLRGLLALNLSVASAGAMVIVNTVVIVRALFGRPDSDVAMAAARWPPRCCCPASSTGYRTDAWCCRPQSSWVVFSSLSRRCS